MAKDKKTPGSGIVKALTGLFSGNKDEVETPEARRARHVRERAADSVSAALARPAPADPDEGAPLAEAPAPATPFSGRDPALEIQVPEASPATGSGWARPSSGGPAVPDFASEAPDAGAALPPGDPEPSAFPELAEGPAAASAHSDFWKRPGVKMGYDFSSESYAEYLQSFGEILQTYMGRSSGKRTGQGGDAAKSVASAHYCLEFSYARLIARVWVHNGAVVAAEYGSAPGDQAYAGCPVGEEALSAIAQNPARALRVRPDMPLEMSLERLTAIHGGPYGIMAVGRVINEASVAVDHDGKGALAATAARKKHESGIFVLGGADGARRVSSGRDQEGLAYFREFQEGEPCTYAHFRVKQPDGSLKSEWCVAIQDEDGLPVAKPGLPTYHFILGRLGREFIVQRHEGEAYCFVTVEGKVTRSGVPIHKVRELLDAPDADGAYVYDGINESLIKTLRDAFQGAEGFPAALVPGRNLAVDFSEATPYGFTVARVRADDGPVRLVVDVHGRQAPVGDLGRAAEVSQEAGFVHVRLPDGRHRYLTERGDLSKTAYGDVCRAGSSPLWVLCDPYPESEASRSEAEADDFLSVGAQPAADPFADADPDAAPAARALVMNARLQAVELVGDDAMAARDAVGFWDSENLSDELRALRESIFTRLM